MSNALFNYCGDLYPNYLKEGNACQFLEPFAKHFCHGEGLDVGCGKWPLSWAIPVDIQIGGDAMALPEGEFDFIASSHCLEHLVNPISALEHWQSRIKSGGVLLLYLPHPSQIYWRPQNCRRHLHTWAPAQMAEIVRDLGFIDVIHSERDLAWSFAVVGFKP